jgi:aminoglycoside phosphotransferase family enzyme
MIKAPQRSGRASEVVRFLRHQCSEVIETHFAWIFLTDLHAYKLKKPVRRGRMDYTTIAARKQVCLDELTLNRRLAPTVYLEVLPITRSRDGILAFGRRRGTRVVDWVVKMRRLPAARMLDRAIAERTLRKQDVQSLVSMLTGFFDGAVRQQLSEPRYVERLLERTDRNRRDLCAPELGLDARCISRIIEMQMAFLEERKALVRPRAAHLIDGHGDLRPEHIYLGSASDSPSVIDCLEFDSELRWVDPAEEIAFLALECRKLGAGPLAHALVAQYRASTLTPPSAALMDFYTSQSAMTRAKLAAWHVRDPELARDAALWRTRASRYLSIAARYIRRASRHLEAASTPRTQPSASTGQRCSNGASGFPDNIRRIASPNSGATESTVSFPAQSGGSGPKW